MKRTTIKNLISILIIGTIVGSLIGCGKTSQSTGTSGTITLAGSTALQPLAEQASKSFMEKNKSVNVNVQGGGSGTGIKLVLEGSVDIGNSDILAEEKIGKENSSQLVDYKVCAIGFALVANKSIKVDSLTKTQIQDIFTGKIKNWKEVGGQDIPIKVINRSKSSGTRTTFINTVMDKKEEINSLTQDSSGGVKKTIETTDGSISYLALSYLTAEVRKDIKVLKIDGVEANKENIINSKYPFWSYEHMYTKGEAKGVSKAFIDYIISTDNKTLVEKLGYIPISDIKSK